VKCTGEKYCDLAKMIEKVSKECDVPESDVMEAVKKLIENYGKK